MNDARAEHPTCSKEPLDQYEFLKWSLEKQESLRTNSIARAGVLAAVSAIIVGAYAFLSQRAALTLGSPPPEPSLLWLLLVDAPVLLGMGLTCYALYCAFDAVVHLRARSPEIIGEPLNRVLLHSGETVASCKNWPGFLQEVRSVSRNTMEERLTAELWGIHKVHALSYERVRRGARCVVWAAILLLVQYVLITLHSASLTVFFHI